MDSPSSTVVERFNNLDQQQFRSEVLALWEAGRQVVDTIIDQVENGPISPLQGLGIIGCTTSQLYGYNAFHGEASSADLVSALATSRERQHA